MNEKQFSTENSIHWFRQNVSWQNTETTYQTKSDWGKRNHGKIGKFFLKIRIS